MSLPSHRLTPTQEAIARGVRVPHLPNGRAAHDIADRVMASWARAWANDPANTRARLETRRAAEIGGLDQTTYDALGYVLADLEESA